MRPSRFGRLVEASAQALQRGEVEVRVAPLQHAHAVEIVVFQPVDGFLFEGFGLAGAAEGAVVHVAAGAAGDLAEFAGVELAVLEAVELAGGGEGHVVDIEVEAHADGVGGHEVIHVAGLVERDLGVAGARATARPAPRRRRHAGAGSVRQRQ